MRLSDENEYGIIQLGDIFYAHFAMESNVIEWGETLIENQDFDLIERAKHTNDFCPLRIEDRILSPPFHVFNRISIFSEPYRVIK